MNTQSKLNSSFLKLFNALDFSIIKSSKNKPVNLKYFNDIIGLNFRDRKNSFVLLESLQLIKSLKQYIRIIKFFKTKDKKHLYVWTEAKHLFLIDLLFNELSLKKNSTLKSDSFWATDFVNYKNKSFNSNYFQFLIMLNVSFNNDKNNLNRFFENRLYLIKQFNSSLKKQNDSIYKTYNDLSDFKKIVFLIIILEKYLKK